MICKRSKKANFTHRELGLLDGQARDFLAGRRAHTQAWCPRTGAPQAPRELSAPGGPVGQGRVLRPGVREGIHGEGLEQEGFAGGQAHGVPLDRFNLKGAHEKHIGLGAEGPKLFRTLSATPVDRVVTRRGVI